MQGELELQPGEPGAQAVVRARAERQGRRRQGCEEVLERPGRKHLGVAVGGAAFGEHHRTGRDHHAADLGVDGDVARGPPVVAERNQMEQALRERPGGLFVRPETGPDLRPLAQQVEQ